MQQLSSSDGTLSLQSHWWSRRAKGGLPWIGGVFAIPIRFCKLLVRSSDIPSPLVTSRFFASLLSAAPTDLPSFIADVAPLKTSDSSMMWGHKLQCNPSGNLLIDESRDIFKRLSVDSHAITSPGKKKHKHKQIPGIVPGTGWVGKLCLCSFGSFLTGEKNT